MDSYPPPEKGCKRLSTNGGMTLVELLSAIAIIAVLFFLTLLIFQRVFREADASKCASNLRQIAMAIHGYAADHQGTLPGPQLIAQGAKRTEDVQLTAYLADYLGQADAPIGTMLPSFICPAWKKQTLGIKNANSQYILIALEDGSIPFGYQSVTQLRPPLKLAYLNSRKPLSQTVVLTELDAQTPSSSAWKALAPAPVHGAYRHTLYLDGRVQRTPVEAP